MRVLFDQGTPAPLRQLLSGHVVETAYERGWSSLQNGQLIAAAEAAGFTIFVTTDRNLKYQQNLASRQMAIVVLLTTSWPRIKAASAPVVNAVNESLPGGYVEVAVP
jgi:predicted nuclease of predicted toxin-antitoxin system